MREELKEKSEINFHHVLPVQIRWNDADVFGHVNNSVYFQFYDTAKTNYIETVCPDVEWTKSAIVMVHVDAEFIMPILSTKKIAIKSAILKIGNKSFTLEQEAVDTNTNEVYCRCRSIMVYMDRTIHSSAPIPQSWVECITKYESDNLNKA
ncbi:MAG TPA: acyl-CoA thioesterase [Paludibacteraceae bacterium]|nr:acyl-CoA thioesterase [Paludibacteraceae bacterium]HQJ89742.1 acyl-CoA thioesterase [Paludibacteraceae bacterium]